MKIFDWVQRKLHGKVDQYKVSHNEESFEQLVELGEKKPAEMEMTHALLEKDHVIGSTLLTIGTFGHFNDGFHPLQEQELQNNKVEEEIVMDQNLNPEVELEPIQVVGKAAEIIEEINLVELEPLLMEEPKKERTTLADLFLESDGQDQSIINSRRSTSSMLLKISSGREKEDYSIKKTKDKTANAKMQRQFSKKKEEISGSKTSKKLHQLITKIVRKKIHPEADDNMQRHNKKKGTYQSISLIW